MQSIFKEAKLPLYFTPHCLRHTYASILLADGISPVYVQEQLGHATIELPVSTYGRWLKKKAPGALDRLDSMQPDSKTAEARGSKVVEERQKGVGSLCLRRMACNAGDFHQGLAEIFRKGHVPDVPGGIECSCPGVF